MRHTLAVSAPLKDSFGPDVPVRIAEAVTAVHPPFAVREFLAESLDGYADLELTPRARQIARALHAHLPAEYDAAVDILLASLGAPVDGSAPQGMAVFFYAPHVYFVAEFGLDHWETSMRAQYELTQRFTAEFSIRGFLEREPERTLARLREWAAGPRPGRFNVDLRVHFVKARGSTSPRVFKVREVELEAGEHAIVSKTISLRQLTTRTHYAGDHPVELIVNGESRPIGSFVVT